MRDNTLKMSKLQQDSRVKYFNSRIEKTAARIKKVEKLMDADGLWIDTEEYQMLSLELTELREDHRSLEAYIDEHNLNYYTEMKIKAQEGWISSYELVSGDEAFRKSITPTQLEIIRKEMKLAVMCSEKVFTVRVDYWRGFISYTIAPVKVEDDVQNMISTMYETKSGIITKRGKHNQH